MLKTQISGEKSNLLYPVGSTSCPVPSKGIFGPGTLEGEAARERGKPLMSWEWSSRAACQALAWGTLTLHAASSQDRLINSQDLASFSFQFVLTYHL